MPFDPKDFPPTAELERVKREDEYYLLYNADLSFADDKTDRGRFRLKEFFENDEKKAKILDVALHLAPLIVDSGSDYLFGKPVQVVAENSAEAQAAVDAILQRTQLERKLKESCSLFQSIGHAQFKLYAEVKGAKKLACVDEVPYSYWFPNWSGVPLGQEPTDVRIVVHLDNVVEGSKVEKYVYVENYYLENGKALCAKSLWHDKHGKLGDQVPLDTLKIPYTGTLTGLTAIEDTGLTELPLVALHVRKTVLDRYGQSVLKKVLPLLLEINDRLTQLSVQFLKHLNAKLQVPEGTITRDPKTGKVQASDMEVLLARQGEEAKYITNDNPLIEQAFEHLDTLIRKVAKLTQTPDTFLTEDEKGGVEKAESLRVRLMSFLKRVSNYETTYRDALEHLLRLALAIEGETTDGVTFKITFDPGLPKEWQADVTVWGDAKAQGLASQETAVGKFQGIEGDELTAELERIQGDEEKFLQSQLDLKTAQPDNPPPGA